MEGIFLLCGNNLCVHTGPPFQQPFSFRAISMAYDAALALGGQVAPVAVNEAAAMMPDPLHHFVYPRLTPQANMMRHVMRIAALDGNLRDTIVVQGVDDTEAHGMKHDIYRCKTRPGYRDEARIFIMPVLEKFAALVTEENVRFPKSYVTDVDAPNPEVFMGVALSMNDGLCFMQTPLPLPHRMHPLITIKMPFNPRILGAETWWVVTCMFFNSRAAGHVGGLARAIQDRIPDGVRVLYARRDNGADIMINSTNVASNVFAYQRNVFNDAGFEEGDAYMKEPKLACIHTPVRETLHYSDGHDEERFRCTTCGQWLPTSAW
jgi:hypothetical protein